MQISISISISGLRFGGTPPLTIPISSSAWTSQEAADDADTRKTFATLTLPNQAEYIYGVYRGPLPEGVLSQIGTMAWDATDSRYEWTSSGTATAGSTVYNRIARRPAALSGPWEWITSPFDTKPWVASNVPSAPTGSWGALSAGTVRVTLAAWNGNGRPVTSASYNRGAGATAFTPAAADTATIVDVTGLTDGVPTSTTFTWTNANGTSDALTLSLTAAGAEGAPPPPAVTYLINGSGTDATVYFDLDEGIEYGGSAITGYRYQIGAGSVVTVSGAGPLVLTGLSATQTLTVEWTNATAYSAPVTIDLIASPPVYGLGGWSVTDAAAPAGDVLTIAIINPVTVPGGLSKIRDEYTLDDGGTWLTLPVDGKISTGSPETLAAVKLRVLYDIGPSVPSNGETATPTFEPIITDFALVTSLGFTTGSTGQTTLNAPIPTHTAGMPIEAAFGVDGAPTVTITEAGWTLTKLSTSDDVSGNLYRAHKIAASPSETLTLNFSTSEQASGVVSVGDGAREAVVSVVDENATTSSRAMDSPAATFGATEKAVGIVFYAQRAEETAPTAGPSGWGAQVVDTTQATSAGVRFGYSVLNVEGTAVDPPAWVGNARRITTAVVAFLPTAGVPPVTAVTVDVSATVVAQGESITWTASADGRAPITYELTVDGSTTTNTTGVFTRTPSTGTRPWTLTASNASGAASTSGSVTIEERLVFTPSSTDPFQIVVRADSVVSGASYELAWQTTAGGTETTVAQSSPDFTINFPASGAYRFRVRAGGGAWSIYGYWAVLQQGLITHTFENAAEIAVSPLSPQAPVVVVPVAGKAPKMGEPLPPLATEEWITINASVLFPAQDGRTYRMQYETAPGAPTITQSRSTAYFPLRVSDAYRFRVAAVDSGVVGTYSDWQLYAGTPGTVAFSYFLHYLNGTMINPSALAGFDRSAGRGPQGWDSRTGDGEAITGIASGFELSLVHQSWPVAMPIGSTASKFVSRPSSDLAVSDFQGDRMGMADQHGGVVVMSALPTTSPLQIAPPIIKPAGWAATYAGLPNYAAMLATLLSTNLSTTGMSVPNATTVRDRVARFDPTGMLLRGGTRSHDSKETWQPFRSAAGSLNNYYAYALDNQAFCLLLSDAVDADWKTDVFNHYVLKGHHWNHPGNDWRAGAGINQSGVFPFMLAQGAKGGSVEAAAVDQRENFPRNYGYWNATTLGYLAPHDDANLPIFSKRRTSTAVARDSTGERITVPYPSLQGSRQQRFEALDLLRVSTGERLKIRPDDRKNTSTIIIQTIGFYATEPVAGEVFVIQIPTAAMANFVAGEPFWMYETASSGFDWQSFNPSPNQGYRNINEPQGGILLTSGLGVLPTTVGSSWQAGKDYHLKTALSNYPGPDGMDYQFTASGFVAQFWAAHATTLGVTL